LAVVAAGAASLGCYLAWQLSKPGLRPATATTPVLTDLMPTHTEGHRIVDAWTAPISPQESDDPGEWMSASIRALDSVAILLTARNALVRLFGVMPTPSLAGGQTPAAFLRDTGPVAGAGQPPPPAGGMPWISEHADHEMVIGLDDKHLDFRIGVTTFGGHVTAITSFKTHNWLGRAYWAVVRLFHRPIVRAMLRQARVPTAA
jgi:hypothetical protein